MAAVDPYWAVLTHPEYKHGNADRGAFFASGEEAVEAMLAVAATLGFPKRRDTALDFGCGLGRLTRALARRFASVYAVDVSASLIDQAKRLNSDVPNCKFEPLAGEDLSMVSDRSIDLAYSILVLQHQSRRTTIRAYLQEFMRVLRPDGLAVFQLPTHIPLRNRIQPRRRAYCALRGLGVPPGVLYARLGLDPLRVLDLPQREVFETIAGAGGRVVTVREDDLAGAFPSATYYVTRPSH